MVTRDGHRLIIFREPPVARLEVMGAAPVGNYVWIGGYWQWHRNDYAWVPGRWVKPPRGRRAWSPAHWEREPRGWYFVDGRWN